MAFSTSPAERDVARAIELLRAGELVAFPTETVYGLGADAENPSAVAKIFALKGRPADHPLIVHIAAAEQVDDWASEVPGAARILADAFWPGPLTLILKRTSRVADGVTGGQETVGLRVPKQALTLAMLQGFAGGIAAPSANRFGRISPTTAAHVRAEFGDSIAQIIDGGACAVGIESTIVDLSRGEPVILRPGTISAANIAEVLGKQPTNSPRGDTPRVSGSLAAHYAPRTPLRLVAEDQLAAVINELLDANRHVCVLARQAKLSGHAHLRWHQLPQHAAAYAHDLYVELRRADAAGDHVIVVEAPPVGDEWLAVADRLRRAAAGSSDEFEP